MCKIINLTSEVFAGKLELCPRCLGRLFGKLGHGLDNPTRGLIVLLVRLIKGFENNDGYDNDLAIYVDTFNFQPEYLDTLEKALDIDLHIHRAGKEQNKKSKTQSHQDLNFDNIQSTISGLIHDQKMKGKIIGLQNKIKEESTEYCNICEGLFDELEHFANLVEKSVEGYEFNNYLIGCRIDNDIKAKEEELWSEFGFDHPEPIKIEFNRELGKLLGTGWKKMVNFDSPDMTVVLDTRYDSISLQIASLFIYGRYRKLTRTLPQTRWPCKRCWGKGCKNCNGTGKLYESSVEEEVAAEVMDATAGKAHFFHGMGREDIGVRMLGSGRPFILEISEPKIRSINMEDLMNRINQYASGKVEVSNLAVTTHQAVRDLKAAKPDKTYRVIVNFTQNVDSEKLKEVIGAFSGKTIKQRTPVRVSHRRADLVRNRKVSNMKLNDILPNGTGAEIEIIGESGLYIKELVTGDSGRTNPSLSEELGLECTVDELDVLNIHDN
jgi:tRNA pseudouridine synthase 10